MKAWEDLNEFEHWLHGRIQETAYLKWKDAGFPENKDLHFWVEAEKEFMLPQILAEVIGSGYGADDPHITKSIEYFKATHGG